MTHDASAALLREFLTRRVFGQISSLLDAPDAELGVDLAAGHQAPPAHLSARSPTSDGLTAREREIAGLLAGGLSNREISRRLVITEGTVEVHVKQMLSKLGFRSRSQVAAWMSSQQSEFGITK